MWMMYLLIKWRMRQEILIGHQLDIEALINLVSNERHNLVIYSRRLIASERYR